MILSESEKNRIKGLYGLLAEADVVDVAINKISNGEFYSDAVSITNLNPESFIDELIDKNPELSNLSDKLKGELKKIDSMSELELDKYIQDISKKVLNTNINEQQKYPGLGIFITSFAVSLIYAIRKAKKDRKLEREMKIAQQKREEERQKREEERQKREEEERIEQEKRVKELEIAQQKRDEERRLERERREEERKKASEERKRQEEERLRKEEEENKVFSDLKGTTVNLYNDSNQQVLFGTVRIQKIRYNKRDQYGSRSGLYIYEGNEEYPTYEIICLSNPDRLAPYIVRRGEYTKDFKYNNKFVSVVKQKAGNFCKKPKATFGSTDKPTDSTKLA